MGNSLNNSQSAIDRFRDNFNFSINSIYTYIGENAFFNVQSTDLTTIRKRFYPPIYDAIMIATSIANSSGIDVSIANEQKRISLLQDSDFRKYISEGTMQIEHINGRIKLALKYLYDYE